MQRILILVEGQTEETFVRDVLDPHLQGHRKCITPTIIVTKRVMRGPNFKGGVTSYNQVKRDIVRLLQDTNASLITTMLDYYALPNDFPGWRLALRSPASDRIAHLERSFAEDIADPRFVPYLSQHEFEALLFADPASAEWVYERRSIVDKLIDIRDEFDGKPENINDGSETAPSKRVKSVFPAYQKTLHGPFAAGAAGLTALRGACPHFHEWLLVLEARPERPVRRR